ncbi:MAG TPA: prepilin-type N-terminal cleavage/methylation domain-containing protein [Longimicrobiales bacterium]|nr:prepilin-type N-terminal cleavage/methylation domain-containing protein [Longimicrobiales bacterium]
MLSNRKGFTLIELLIVVVIIGILAAIAIPKFSATREKAYFAAMKSDLKNLQSQQEIYYSNGSYEYTADQTALEFAESSGVTVSIAMVGNDWGATAVHAALETTQQCGVFVGGGTAAGTPATVPGVVTCTGE